MWATGKPSRGAEGMSLLASSESVSYRQDWSSPNSVYTTSIGFTGASTSLPGADPQ